MSDTNHMHDLNTFPIAASTDLTGAQFGGLRWFTFRPAGTMLLASAAVSMFALVGMVKLSDKILESNNQAQQIAASVPPPEYYELMASLRAESTDEAGKPAAESAAAANQ